MDLYDEYAIALKAAAHPVRLEILRFLLSGPGCASSANKTIPVSQPNLSQHLKILSDADLIDFCRIGTRKCFYLSKPDFIKELFILLDKKFPKIMKRREDILNEISSSQHHNSLQN